MESPLPGDRPDVAPSWASELLVMEAVVRSFPPGSAAGPSGILPQHLLDFLNSADSAAKAGLLDAPLTLVTAAVGYNPVRPPTCERRVSSHYAKSKKHGNTGWILLQVELKNPFN